MRQRIIQVAAQAMNERGTKFTIDTIVQRLGISKKTLYQYVSSKEELIRLIVNVGLEDICMQQSEILQSDKPFLEKLTSLLTLQPHIFGPINDWVFDDVKNFCPTAWDDIEKFRRNRTQVIINLLEAGKEQGFIRPLNSHIIDRILQGAFSEILDYKFLSNANLTLQDAITGCVNLLIHGMVMNGGNDRE